jgi:hypothetical protein
MHRTRKQLDINVKGREKISVGCQILHIPEKDRFEVLDKVGLPMFTPIS